MADILVPCPSQLSVDLQASLDAAVAEKGFALFRLANGAVAAVWFDARTRWEVVVDIDGCVTATDRGDRICGG